MVRCRWHDSTTVTLDAVTNKFSRHGRTVDVIDLHHQHRRHEQLSRHLGRGHGPRPGRHLVELDVRCRLYPTHRVAPIEARPFLYSPIAVVAQ